MGGYTWRFSKMEPDDSSSATSAAQSPQSQQLGGVDSIITVAVSAGTDDEESFPRPPDSIIRSERVAASQPAQSDPLRHFIAGAIGGSTAAALLSPLDIVRTRLQSAGSAKMRPDRLFLHIYRAEGLLAFYRGLVPTILGVGPSRAMYFGFFSHAKNELTARDPAWSGAPLHLTSALAAGIATNSLMSPWWVVRLRLQLQTTPVEPVWAKMRARMHSSLAQPLLDAPGAVARHTTAAVVPSAAVATASPPIGSGYLGVADAVRRIYREEGFRAFYRGLTASYLGVLETGLQFAIYGAVKEAIIRDRYASTLEQLRAARAAEVAMGRDSAPIERAEVTRAAYGGSAAFLNSAISKLIASVATYPHEVVRTRLREQRTGALRYAGIVDCVVRVAREEGARGLYGGMSVHLLRTVPNATILLWVVERMVGGGV